MDGTLGHNIKQFKKTLLIAHTCKNRDALSLRFSMIVSYNL